jgi:trimeric autotransporter adhesin
MKKSILKLNILKQIKISVILIIGMVITFIAGCKNGIDNPVPPEPQKDYLEYGNVVKKGLIAYYPFDGNAKDYSGGNEYNGVLHGPSASVGRFGQQNGALKFDGVDDYIEIPNFTNFNSDSGTICFWARSPDTTLDDNREAAVISKIDTLGLGYVLSVFDINDFWFNYKNYKSQILMDEETMWTNYWGNRKYLFITVTFTNNTITYYFQGYHTAKDSIVQGTVFTFNDNKQPLFIGKSLISHYKFYEGEIEDLLIYNRALSKDEILKLYNWK